MPNFPYFTSSLATGVIWKPLNALDAFESVALPPLPPFSVAFAVAPFAVAVAVARLALAVPADSPAAALIKALDDSSEALVTRHRKS
ncbi:hypothetical protein VC83_07134 [Pseudogymnoascus destructans]|uniref:Uncharacterized protein n=2 Tax=Pseudogymnoascus destructans TaxID=655981 RepID=L8G1V2_PSED2|nr:uncharacterized protein VC83_07134 [Pseudogymnoascus destructans]ELR07250.1 hypothetical protein GMDG_08321 [Pseudogymnoascus destructans 20631-21]OAF56662.1 hypothetical protein VC83_07134 [Pseudogymnoascus destructans]